MKKLANSSSMRWLPWTVALVCALMTSQSEAGKKAQEAAPKPPQKEAAEAPSHLAQPLITVDDWKITSAEYATFLQQHPQIVSRAMTSEIGKADALREMVMAYLLRKAMYDEGLLKRDEQQPTQNEVVTAYEALAKRHFPLPETPKDEEAYAYYQAHPSAYGIPAMIRASEILVKVDPKADAAVKAKQRGKAEELLKQLDAGETFSDVAAKSTENPIGKLTRGDIGFVNLDEQAWMKSALGSLRVGEKTGVVESPEGFVILTVTDIRPALISPYVNVRDKVIKDLRDEEQEKLRRPYVEGLAAKSKIEVVSPFIKPLFPNGVFAKP